MNCNCDIQCKLMCSYAKMKAHYDIQASLCENLSSEFPTKSHTLCFMATEDSWRLEILDLEN